MRARAHHFSSQNSADSSHPDIKRRSPHAALFESIDESTLPAHEKDEERLAQEGFTMIGAGGETTSRVLAIAMFHILSNPDILKRLQEEIMTVMPNASEMPSGKALEESTYLVIEISKSPSPRTHRLI